MISFDEASAIVARLARPMELERVPIDDALGRTLAAPVIARIDAPPRAVSAMDGYALRDADLNTLPARLPVVREIFAGDSDPGRIRPGECARIFTGAPVPAGTERVVIQERVTREGDVAVFDAAPGQGRNIRTKGSDFLAGGALLEAGRTLDSRALLTAAGGDNGVLQCWRRPRVVILATGDELAPPGEAHQRAGTIPESVSIGIAAIIREWGGEIVRRERLPDALGIMQEAAARALGDADLVVVTGGASVGERDFAKTMFEPAGLKLLFAKVAIKPGKPVWLGRCGETLVMGLPGNPTSAMVTARLLLAPLVAGLAGGTPDQALRWQELPLGSPLGPCGDRETFARARIDDGQLIVATNQDSSAQCTLGASDALLRLMPHCLPRERGERVEALAF